MSMKAYLISAIIGAVIGYITNWLAIKMLFKPHNEKRIFGIKVPFTPGLIPKEKERIAKSVGDTVGEHILTNEIIAESLRNEEILNGLKDVLNKKIDEVFDSNDTIDNIVKNIGGNKNYIKEDLKENSYKKLKDIIVNEENISNYSKYIFNYILDKLKQEPLIIKKIVNNKKFQCFLIDINRKQKENKVLDKEIKTLISEKALSLIDEDKDLGDIIPEEISDNLSNFIYSQRDIIAENIIKALENDKFSLKIKEIIGNVLPSMLSMFMSIDSLYEKLFSAIKEYLLVEENKIIICNYIVSVLSNLENTKVESIIRTMSEDDFNNVCQCIADLVNNNLLNDENMLGYIGKLEGYLLKLDSYESIILKIDKDYKKHGKEYLDKIIVQYLSDDEFNNIIKNGLSIVIEDLFKLRIKDIFNDKEKAFNFIWNIVESYYNNFIEKDAEELVKIINIPGLVEKQINSFDVSYAEKLIVGIAKKELGAITWLGALLGALLGILSPLLSRLYS